RRTRARRGAGDSARRLEPRELLRVQRAHGPEVDAATPPQATAPAPRQNAACAPNARATPTPARKRGTRIA
ncbi:MAG: hypothetical protein ACK5BX_09535, partial [Bradyrhizobium sp.]